MLSRHVPRVLGVRAGAAVSVIPVAATPFASVVAIYRADALPGLSEAAG